MKILEETASVQNGLGLNLDQRENGFLSHPKLSGPQTCCACFTGVRSEKHNSHWMITSAYLMLHARQFSHISFNQRFFCSQIVSFSKLIIRLRFFIKKWPHNLDFMNYDIRLRGFSNGSERSKNRLEHLQVSLRHAVLP